MIYFQLIGVHQVINCIGTVIVYQINAKKVTIIKTYELFQFMI